MKITADTNVLVRAVTGDHARQSKSAREAMARAQSVALPLPALCELAWVLSDGYRVAVPDIAEVIRRLINAANVAVNRAAVEAGLEALEAGGDFADGIIAHEGQWLGAETFMSFDKKAVRLLQKQGKAAVLLK